MGKLSKIWDTQMLFQAESWQVTMIPKPLNTPILWLIFPCDQNLGEWTVHNLWSALIGSSIPIAIRTSALGFERLVIRGHPDNGQGMEGNFYLWWWSQDLWNPCGSSFLTNVQNPSRMCSMPWISWNWLLRIAIRLCLVLSQSPPGRIGNCTSKGKLALS